MRIAPPTPRLNGSRSTTAPARAARAAVASRGAVVDDDDGGLGQAGRRPRARRADAVLLVVGRDHDQHAGRAAVGEHAPRVGAAGPDQPRGGPSPVAASARGRRSRGGRPRQPSASPRQNARALAARGGSKATTVSSQYASSSRWVTAHLAGPATARGTAPRRCAHRCRAARSGGGSRGPGARRRCASGSRRAGARAGPAGPAGPASRRRAAAGTGRGRRRRRRSPPAAGPLPRRGRPAAPADRT